MTDINQDCVVLAVSFPRYNENREEFICLEDAFVQQTTFIRS